MAAPQTRREFKDYCLRRLGWPVIDINVDDDQVEDRIDDALSFWNDYHFDGTEKMFMKHRIIQADIDRKWIYCPDAVSFVTGVMRFDDSNSSVNMFDLRYQLRLHDLYDFTSVSYVSYEITMQHIQTLNLLFSGTPQFRFNRKQNKVFLDIDWSRDVNVGDYVVIECYRKLQPSSSSLTGTVNLVAGSTVVLGTNTIFDQELLEGDFLTFGSETIQVDKILSPTQITLSNPPTNTSSNVTMILEGLTDIWDDRWLKGYATAKIKYQWGSNMKKFGGIQLPGGVVLNGKELYDEAVEEIGKLEEQLYNASSMPSEIFIG
jgi:sporulation protein YlmC with PRC-barrel domain